MKCGCGLVAGGSSAGCPRPSPSSLVRCLNAECACGTLVRPFADSQPDGRKILMIAIPGGIRDSIGRILPAAAVAYSGGPARSGRPSPAWHALSSRIPLMNGIPIGGIAPDACESARAVWSAGSRRPSRAYRRHSNGGLAGAPRGSDGADDVMRSGVCEPCRVRTLRPRMPPCLRRRRVAPDAVR